MKQLLFLMLLLSSVANAQVKIESSQESILLDTDVEHLLSTATNEVSIECTKQIENAKGHLEAKALLLAKDTLKQCREEKGYNSSLFPGEGILREHNKMFVLGGKQGTEFQISFKFPIFDLSFYEGAEGLFFGYTQNTFATPGWDVRETNYQPEIFYDLYSIGGENFKLDRFRLGMDTLSNGEENDNRRSIQSAYVEIAGAYVFSKGTYIKYSTKYKNYNNASALLDRYQDEIGTSESIYAFSYGGNELVWTKLGENINQLDLYFKDPWSKLRPYWYIQYYNGPGMSLNRNNKIADNVIRFGVALNH